MEDDVHRKTSSGEGIAPDDTRMLSPTDAGRPSLTLSTKGHPPPTSPQLTAPTSPRIHYDLSVEPGLAFPSLDTRNRSGGTHRDLFSPNTLRRRNTRAATFRTIDGPEDLDLNFHSRDRMSWKPGAEPGYDRKLPDGGHSSTSVLSARCDITVVDYSLERITYQKFENDSFIEFMKQPQPEWAKCRWININGLSWDVIQAVGARKGLHKLALEDIMNIRNRTKADWYPNHAFIIMTLQKLVHVVEAECDDVSISSSTTAAANRVRSFLRRTASSAIATDPEKRGTTAGQVFPDGPILPETTMLRSLHRYHASPNEARIEFMEHHSPLAEHNLAISAEQVSMFLTSDNTLISFFEVSASDIEQPIVTRLSTPGTILRESCDASLLAQAIVDAIIDLAIPLTAAYADIIGDLELDVLTAPSIKQSKRLYICISEMNKMLRFLLPIDNLVNVLRDHRTLMTQEQAARELQNPASGVIISPMTHTYLGDVLDHCIIIAESLQQLKQSSENLINLIFNTITANQDESMKQLTFVTIIFLPLTFITGFFGQNFESDLFPEIHHGIWYL